MHNLTISGYTTLRMLGEGGMSTVWYAENRLKLPAAIKFLKRELLVVPAIRQRFRDETEALTRLSHPNIRAVLDYEETDSYLAIVFEYIDGQDLGEWLETHGPASTADAKKWILQALSALQQAHDQGIVHRDIKPANLFLTRSGDLKILDFGIAKIVGSEASLTRTNRAIGSPMYMSPEQVRTPKDVDHRSDLYSLGVTLHALLAGRKPYDDETDSEFDILRKVVEEPLPPLGVASRASATSFPEPVEGNDTTRTALNAIIARATTKNRNDRYPDCAAFAADLQNISVEIARSDVNATTPAKLKPVDITLVEGIAVPPVATTPAMPEFGRSDRIDFQKPVVSDSQPRIKRLPLIATVAVLLTAGLLLWKISDWGKQSATERERSLLEHIADSLKRDSIEKAKADIATRFQPTPAPSHKLTASSTLPQQSAPSKPFYEDVRIEIIKGKKSIYQKGDRFTVVAKSSGNICKFGYWDFYPWLVLRDKFANPATFEIPANPTRGGQQVYGIRYMIGDEAQGAMMIKINP